MKILGKCPYCENGKIESRKVKVNGKEIKLYACSNAHWKTEFETTQLTDDSICGFRIFQNTLKKWNKAAIGENEIKKLLKDGELEVKLHSQPFFKWENGKRIKFHTEYTKFIITNKEYGIEVIWD
jgi:hypothetical protein